MDKLSVGKLAKLATVVHMIQEEKGMNGVLGITHRGVHMETEVFFTWFTDYTVSLRDSEDYPYELVSNFAGVRFYCITKEGGW